MVEMLPHLKIVFTAPSHAMAAASCASVNRGELFEAVQTFESRNEAIPGFYADELNNLGNIHFQVKSAADLKDCGYLIS